MRRIAVVTGGRADYGIYRPVLRNIASARELELQLLVCGAHLSDDYGRTVDVIENDDFPIAARIPTLEAGDAPLDIARAMANGLAGFGRAYADLQPDLVLVLGDRYEMFAAAAAAMPFSLPLAHIHGGESTEGLIDEAIRHSITKMSHVHFVSTQRYRDRVVQLGEHPERVIVTGAPSLDNLGDLTLMDDAELSAAIGMPLDPAPLLVTFHPVTLEYQDTATHIDGLLSALGGVTRPILFTYPNADTFGRVIIGAINRFVAERSDAVACPNLGTRGFFSLMNRAAAMVGNSSSGIIEAASFGLPVVNIGNRQKGRIHGRNVLDCAPDAVSIRATLDRALDPQFKDGLRGMANPYGDGTAAARIVDTLTKIELGPALIQKAFYDLPPTSYAGP